MYIHLLVMATKCITITTEAYERLASKKKENESFSEVINRIVPRYTPFDLIGLLTHKDAKELKKHREELNREMEKELDEVAARLK